MTCRRICRELIELFRFGGLDVRSAPHLDHLAECRSCRDEVGFDRALVRELRSALLARVAGASPSPDAWAAILARAQAPETSSGVRAWFRRRSVVVLSRLRAATGASAMALAVVIAAGTDATIGQPQPAPVQVERGSLEAANRFERGAMAPRPHAGGPERPTVAFIPPRRPSDPEAAMQASASSYLPPAIAGPQAGEPPSEAVEQQGPTIVFSRPSANATPADTFGPAPGTAVVVDRGEPVTPQPGAPS